MANTRNIVSPGTFANDALTTIPPAPVQGVAYRSDTNLSENDVEQGWPYAIPPASDVFNEIMYRVTALVGIMDGRGMLGWTQFKEYTVGAVQLGSDFAMYQALRASGPSTTPRDPVLEPTYWGQLGTASGTVIYHAANSAPSGYLPCNGAAVSRAIYARLFNAIGTTWGVGDGSTTFNVPDLRGEFIRGFDAGRNVDSGRVFATAQAQRGGLLTVETRQAAASVPPPVTLAVPQDGSLSAWANTGDASTATDVDARFANANDLRPRNVTLLACIKV